MLPRRVDRARRRAPLRPAASLALLVLLGPFAWAERATAEVETATAPETKATSLSKAPDFSVTLLDGGKFVLAEALAKGPVLIDFWTTWCAPCLKELPELAKLHEKYAERGFSLITIASDDAKTASKIKPLAKSRGFEFPIGTDPDRKIGNAYSVRNYPTSFLIAPDGRIASVALGYRAGDEKKLEEEIVALLGGTQ